MKLPIIVIHSLLIFQCAAMQPNGPYNFNLNVTQNAHLNNQQQPTVTLTMPMAAAVSRIEQLPEQAPLFTSNLVSRLTIGLGAVTATYAGLFIAVLRAKAVICAKNDLASWRCEVALQALQELPKNTILLDLMRMAQKSTNNKTQSAILAFLEQIAHEEQTLQRYKKIISAITFLKATSIFPDISTLATQLEEKLQRLAFMRNCIQEWLLLAEHELLQTT